MTLKSSKKNVYEDQKLLMFMVNIYHRHVVVLNSSAKEAVIEAFDYFFKCLSFSPEKTAKWAAGLPLPSSPLTSWWSAG